MAFHTFEGTKYPEIWAALYIPDHAGNLVSQKNPCRAIFDCTATTTFVSRSLACQIHQGWIDVDSQAGHPNLICDLHLSLSGGKLLMCHQCEVRASPHDFANGTELILGRNVLQYFSQFTYYPKEGLYLLQYDAQYLAEKGFLAPATQPSSPSTNTELRR